jgi:deazaflavin-dependent oxidoreductase (nitroreductase family)
MSARRRFLKAAGGLHNVVYRASGGKIGGRVQGMPVLLLTTTGRKSGKTRTTPLLYLRDGADIAVVASDGGNDAAPAWWLNLRAKPAAHIELGRHRIPVTARKASPEERDRLWPAFTEGYNGYAKYITRTTREIPVVILEPS